jgi:hypothetical protein
MKRTAVVIAFLVLILASSLTFAQTVIENPAKPDNPRAGRTVTLQEVMRIEDTGKDFTITGVYGLQASADGSVFVRDEWKQLLQFDSRGRFVRNLVKKGEGPGELTEVYGHLVIKQNVLLFGNPRKALIFDLAGNLVNEVSLLRTAAGPTNMVAAVSDKLIFVRDGFPDLKGGGGWRDFPTAIDAISLPKGQLEKLGIFPIRGFVDFSYGDMRLHQSSQLLVVATDDRTLAITHTSEYLIKVFDTMTRTVGAVFKRPYKRQARIVSRESGGASGMGARAFKPPEFINDIFNLHAVDGKIWVQTSTVDAHKGILFDVFDQDGRYLDCFYLKWSDKEVDLNSRWQKFVFAGGFVYFDDKNADDLVVIKKCRLVGL